MIAVIDPRMPSSAKEQLKKICEVAELPPFSALDGRVASHPDMLLFISGGKLFTSKEYYKEAKDVIDGIILKTALALALTNDVLGNKYPDDVKFNVFTTQDSIVGSIANISEEIKKHAYARGWDIKNVNQGYAKCSTVVLKNAVITADKGIYNQARELGANGLLISAGGVTLEGYGCGFIGGASGVFENKVFFCGNIMLHPDGKSIVDFCEALGYEIISLSNAPLYDVGTITFI